MTGRSDSHASLFEALGERVGPLSSLTTGGVVTGEATGRRFFVKRYPAERSQQQTAEVDGLRLLRESTAFTVPRVLFEGAGMLILPWLEAKPGSGSWCQREFGRLLARMHQVRGPQFGYKSTTYCGPTPQDNQWTDDWVRFFWERRLMPMAALLEGKGGPADLSTELERISNAIAPELTGDAILPSLVHGDLWQGNVLRLGPTSGLIDPALYFGHSEVDLAMLTLFGQPHSEFWSGYGEISTIRPGYMRRFAYYNLFHIMNHCALFGGGYWGHLKAQIRLF